MSGKSLIAFLVAAALCACASTAAQPKISVASKATVAAKVDAAAAPAGATGAGAAAEGAGEPVTHLGRTALSRSDLAVLGRVGRISPPVRGTEIAQVEVLEVLHPDPESDSVTITIFGNQPGFLPPVGHEAIFLLKLRPRSNNFDALDVAPLEGGAGRARLATFRDYVRIESLPDDASRVAALLAHLRTAVLSTDKWTRWNAAREYAAFSKVRPKALTVADSDALTSALRRARSPALKAMLGDTLDVTGVRPPDTTDDKAALLSELQAAYDQPGAALATRRAAVIDAAARCGDLSRSLIEKALGDEAAAVREAAVAGAAELRLDEVGPLLVHMLATESSVDVRRSLVRALGYLREETAVGSLAALAAQTGDFSREACFALARIRSEEALERLRDVGRRASDEERKELVVFLLSDAFAEQEKALGR